MPRDYAKYVNKTKGPHVKRGWSKRLLLIGLACFVLAMGIFGVYHYKQNSQDDTQPSSLQSFINQSKSLFFKSSVKQESELTNDLTEKNEPESDIQFSFYTSLPNMQVPGPQEVPSQIIVVHKEKSKLINPSQNVAIHSSPKPSPVLKREEEKYLLQIAAFKNPTAAGEMRISLLLAGFEVEIVKALNNNQQLYQLQQGPFTTVNQAKLMQREMKKKGIESVIVKKLI